jgi:hypothetical protein
VEKTEFYADLKAIQKVATSHRKSKGTCEFLRFYYILSKFLANYFFG